MAVVAQRFADRIAVVDRTHSITYAALFRKAAGLAHLLIAAGVKPGDPVASFVRNGIPAVWTGYGITLSGAAEVAMNPGLNDADRRHCLTLADVRHVVTTVNDAGLFKSMDLRIHAIDDVAERPLVAAELAQVTMEDWARIRIHLWHDRAAQGDRHDPAGTLDG